MTLSSLGKYAYDVIWTDTFLDINSNAVVLRRVSKYFDPEHFSVRSVDICLIHVKFQIWQKPKISPSDVIKILLQQKSDADNLAVKTGIVVNLQIFALFP